MVSVISEFLCGDGVMARPGATSPEKVAIAAILLKLSLLNL